VLHTIDQFLYFSEAQARRGEETEIDPDQFQDPDNEYGLFAGTTYEADDEEADKIYEKVDEAMDSRRKPRRCVFVVSVEYSAYLIFCFFSICS